MTEAYTQDTLNASILNFLTTSYASVFLSGLNMDDSCTIRKLLRTCKRLRLHLDRLMCPYLNKCDACDFIPLTMINPRASTCRQSTRKTLREKANNLFLVRAKIWKKVNMRASFDPSCSLKAEQLALLLAVPSTRYTLRVSVIFISKPQ
jgi:hypothetical protein